MNFKIFHQLGFLSVLSLASLGCSGGVIDDGGPAAGGSTTSGGSSAGGGSASGGGSAAGGGSGAGASYCDFEAIMVNSCDGLACHGSPGYPAQFYTDFFNPPEGKTVGQMLLGVEAHYDIIPPASQGSCASPPEQLINPSSPADSLLLKKVLGTQSCGGRMPDGNGLPQADVDCLTDWINGVVAAGP